MENYGIKNRNKKSIQRICGAMLEVLKEKEFEQISITEICLKAEVARKTFYRNFDSKEFVIKKMIDLKLSEFETMSLLKEMNHPRELSKKYFEFWYEHREFLKILYDRNLFSILNYKYDLCMIELRNLFYGEEEESLEREYGIKFISGGVWNILQTWVRKDFNETPIQMANFTTKYMNEFREMHS